MSMQGKVTKVDQLPEWFDISKYLTNYSEEFESFIRDSLKRRLSLLECVEGVGAFLLHQDNSPTGQIWQEFKACGCFPEKASVRNFQSLEESEEKDIFNDRAPETGHVKPIKLGRGVTLGEISKHYLDSYKRLAESQPHPKVEFLDQILSVDDYFRDALKPANLHLNVDLTASDHQILSEMKLLLPQLRLRYEMDRRSKQIFSLVDRRKVVDYRIIPLIDLKIWEIESNKEIATALLEKVLFKDAGKDIGHLTKTVMPFFSKKIRNPDFIVQWQVS
ncbi:DUF6387 family protein [Neptunomonas phycophila]|uniref:DUF6387 family protein n=1 Tax=Neptunomonas phycophila TaxID=1572645 RepID=UPI0037357F58